MLVCAHYDMIVMQAGRESGNSPDPSFAGEPMGKISHIYEGNLYARERKGKPHSKSSKKKTGYKCGPVLIYTPDSFYSSEPWLRIRYEALRIHGARCQCCGRSRHDNLTMHVDHIKPRSRFPNLELDINNLQILCNECNIGKSNTDSTDWRQKTRPYNQPPSG